MQALNIKYSLISAEGALLETTAGELLYVSAGCRFVAAAIDLTVTRPE